jgi:hypothetical protein
MFDSFTKMASCKVADTLLSSAFKPVLSNLKVLAPLAMGAAVLADSLGDVAGGLLKPTIDTLGYRLYESVTPEADRYRLSQAPEEGIKAFTKQLGTDMGKGLSSSVSGLVSGFVDKNKSVLLNMPQRKAILDALRREDPMIKNLPIQEAIGAYNSMIKVAPTLSLDKNAVKSFLRTVSTAPGAGVDWNTLKGLADAEASMNKALNPMGSKGDR